MLRNDWANLVLEPEIMLFVCRCDQPTRINNQFFNTDKNNHSTFKILIVFTKITIPGIQVNHPRTNRLWQETFSIHNSSSGHPITIWCYTYTEYTAQHHTQPIVPQQTTNKTNTHLQIAAPGWVPPLEMSGKQRVLHLTTTIKKKKHQCVTPV